MESAPGLYGIKTWHCIPWMQPEANSY